MSKIRIYTWEILQNIIGVFVKLIFKGKFQFNYKDAKIHSWSRMDGVSLGSYIFVPEYACKDENNITNFVKHEYGHTIQSKYLGPLYLLVIALPSLIWAGCFGEFRKKNNISYYTFYTEKWADELGGVDR